jgi:hypothetical protein
MHVAADERLEHLRARFLRARESWDGGDGGVSLSSGLEYLPGEPVSVLVRRRGRRYDIGDDGAAVRLAGSPRGWLRVAERLVAEDALNVNRRGVVFVQAVEGRDVALLAWRVAAASLAVYQELLEL